MLRTPTILVVRLLAVAASFGVGASTPAAEWAAAEGDLGLDQSRIRVNAALAFGELGGSEVQKTNTSSGFEVGAAYRVWRAVSVWGSFALDGADIEGRLQSVLDVNVRDDARSGRVAGDIETTRLRGGIRLDAFREQQWRFRPYLTLAYVYSQIQVDVASVDGRLPRSEVRSFENTENGALARVGLDFPLFQALSIDLSGSFEVIEGPPGTNNLFAFASGLSYRL